jgi:hypothetical protein
VISIRSPAAALALAVLGAGLARGAEIDTGTEVSLRLDTTLTESTLFRTSPQDASVLANINGDDGDRAFAHGLVSGRFDLLEEAEAEWQGIGARASFAAWYDPVVFGRTQDTSPRTYNPVSVPATRLPADTRRLEGLDAELLDAFLRLRLRAADVPVTVRVGQYALLWGESLFLTDNGIAAGMAPVDRLRGAAQPDATARELFRPVPQLSLSAQITPRWNVQAFLQPVWRPDRVPGVGDFFSSTDLLDAGGERLLLVPGRGVPRAPDRDPEDAAFGAAVRLALPELTLGLYALRYDAKQPSVVLEPHDYRLVYSSGIDLFGASASGYLGTATLAGEISARRGMPLASRAGVVAPGEAAVPRGDTLHAQISLTSALAPSRWWDDGSVSAEVGANTRLAVTAAPARLDPSRTRLGGEGRAVLTLTYYRVLPALDLSPSLGAGGGLFGRSSLATTPPLGTGDVTLGLGATWRVVWHATLAWTHQIGGALQDRDFLALSFRRSF